MTQQYRLILNSTLYEIPFVQFVSAREYVGLKLRCSKSIPANGNWIILLLVSLPNSFHNEICHVQNRAERIDTRTCMQTRKQRLSTHATGVVETFMSVHEA